MKIYACGRGMQGRCGRRLHRERDRMLGKKVGLGRGERREEGRETRKAKGDLEMGGFMRRCTFYTGNSDDVVSVQMTQNEVYEQKPEALIQVEQNVVYGVTIPPRNPQRPLQQGPDSLQLTPADYTIYS